MLAMRACTNKCKSGEYGVRSPSTGTRLGEESPLPGLYRVLVEAC